MLLWTLIALMTGAATLAALWPLRQTRRVEASAPEAGESARPEASDVAVYKDQLGELAREADRGLIAMPEAEAARLEIARRLIAADRAAALAAPPGRSIARTRAAAITVLVAVPAIGLSLYGLLGSPGLPDLPLQARLDAPAETASLDELVMRVEAHLAKAPDDAKGWEILAPIYLRTGRFSDARLAFANLIRINGSSPEREAALGEAIAYGAEGVVTAEARAAFERALRLDAGQAKARYYLGRAKEQDGDGAGAVAAWKAILVQVPADSAVAAFLGREIARLDPGSAGGTAAPPGPDSAAMAAASEMAPADRDKMIRGMVEGLDARLRAGGGSEEEWLRLVRAWSVLGEKSKASAAVGDARKALAGSPDALRALDDLARSLGLPG